MTALGRNGKLLSISTAICVPAAIAIGIASAYPITVESPILGSEWSCRRVLMVTTCDFVGVRGPSNDPELTAHLPSSHVPQQVAAARHPGTP